MLHSPLLLLLAMSPREAKPGISARPSEPILIPKLRIEFADFPYPRVSDSAEATNLGDQLRKSGTLSLEHYGATKSMFSLSLV